MEAGLRVEVLMPWRLVMHMVANVDLLEVRDELQDLAIDAKGQAIHARILSFDPFFSTHTHTRTFGNGHLFNQVPIWGNLVKRWQHRRCRDMLMHS